MLEAELVRRPQLPAEASAEGGGGTGRLPTTEELSQIHDELLGPARRGSTRTAPRSCSGWSS